MDLSFQKAKEGLEAREVPVGCVILYNDRVIASSRNTVNITKNATRHAEINCVDQVLQWCDENQRNPETVFPDVEVFVTVEPCIMCMCALKQLSVKNITFGCANDRFGGCGTVLSIHEDKMLGSVQELKIAKGVRTEEAVDLLKNFYRGENPNAPFPKLKTSEIEKTATSRETLEDR